MKNKDTDGLRQELMDSPDLTQFLSQNEELFANKSVAELLTHLFEKKTYIKGRTCQAGRYERDLSAPDLCRQTDTFPQSPALPVLRPWDHH